MAKNQLSDVDDQLTSNRLMSGDFNVVEKIDQSSASLALFLPAPLPYSLQFMDSEGFLDQSA